MNMNKDKENQSRVSRVSKQSLPDFDGENLEEYMYLFVITLGKFYILIKNNGKNKVNIWKLIQRRKDQLK